MSPRRLLFLIWLCFLIRAGFYATALPMWEGFDEYSHFGVIEHVSLHHDLPDHRSAITPRRVAASLRLTPSPWLIRNPANGRISYEEYWALPREQRAAMQAHLRSLNESSGELSDGADPPIPLWEAQQPPLFYWICVPVFWLIKGATLLTQVWILRFLCALVSSALIPFAFLAARVVIEDWRLALGVPVVLASMPELMISSARISNESLSIALGAAVALLGLRMLKAPNSLGVCAAFGVILGLALVTKAYFLAFLPWAAFVALYSSWKISRQRAITQALLVFAVCFAICGWWYVRTFLLTGTITGEEREVGARGTLSLMTAIRQTPWPRVLDLIATSHIWLGGWSFLVVRSYMYRIVEAIFAAAIVGVGFHFASPRTNLPAPAPLWSLVFLFVSLLVGLCYHATTGVGTPGGPGTMGYYLYCLAAPEAILLTVGLARLLPRRLLAAPMALVPTLVTSIFIGLEAYGLWFVQIPYYNGMIRHNTNGSLPAFRWTQLSGGGLRTMMNHWSANLPAFFTPAVPGVRIALFLCATGLFFVAGWRAHAGSSISTSKPGPALDAFSDP